MEFTSDVVIGLEIHIEPDLNTKLFCGCSRRSIESEEPNTRTCQVCLGHPGAKPRVNKRAIEFALKLCLASKCEVAKELIFSRKNYFYPDMAKNYQTSQYELPLGSNGKLKLKSGKEIRINRIHVEEDPASLVHPKGMTTSQYVLIDYNRSGNTLFEMVTEPDMTSPEEARDFMKKLITLLDYLEIFDLNNGIIKADANVSIKESGYIRSEVKNITGFKEIERALFYEVQRQKEAVKNNEKLIQDTRAWDAEKGTTSRMRTKETDIDYGYIIDPDLVSIAVPKSQVEEIKKNLPELADEKMEKFKEQDIDGDTAEILAKDKHLAKIYERASNEINPDLASKWVRRELPRVLNYNKKSLDDVPMTDDHFITLLRLLEKKTITEKVAQKILEKLLLDPFDVEEYVKKEGLGSIADTGALVAFCKEAITENPGPVDEYKSGKEQAINFLVGQVMRKTKGTAAPGVVLDVLKKLLSE